MSIGATLIELQDIDLALERDRAALEEMPELAQLAAKRKTYVKLKSQMKRLFAVRKDFETDLADLDADEERTKREVDEAQAQAAGLTDYREVQDLEVRLSSLAKTLDKIAFTRAEVAPKLAEARERENKLADYIKRFEAVVTAETRAARERAGALKDAIAASERERERVVSSLDADSIALYDRASARFRGLAVERLNGAVPSVCRTTLSPSSLSDLEREGEVGECPYCHRILIKLPEGDE